MKRNEILLYAMHNYNNYQCIDIEEFRSDMKMIRKINSLIDTRNKSDARRCLNNIIIAFNLFSVAALTLLFLHTEREKWGHLMAYIDVINRLPRDLAIAHIDVGGAEIDEDTAMFLNKLIRGTE